MPDVASVPDTRKSVGWSRCIFLIQALAKYLIVYANTMDRTMCSVAIVTAGFPGPRDARRSMMGTPVACHLSSPSVCSGSREAWTRDLCAARRRRC